MKTKKDIKIFLYSISIFLLLILCIIGYLFYNYNTRSKVDKEKYPFTIEYIAPEKALLNEGFDVCNENFIVQYYNPQRATYSKGKNGLREFIITHYKNRNYTDSGYLNIRFIINCKGEAGRYVIHENNLNLEPIEFNKDLVNQLFNLTTQLKKWNPNYTYETYRDSYMYISYRIENGKITEILP